jgi:hypothetical protein
LNPTSLLGMLSLLCRPGELPINGSYLFLVSWRGEHGVALRKTAQHGGTTPCSLSGRVKITVPSMPAPIMQWASNDDKRKGNK